MMKPAHFHTDAVAAVQKNAPSGSFPGLPRGRRRVALLGTILLATILWAHAASAENPLLRGPRIPLRPNAAAAEPAGRKDGLLEKIAAAPVIFYQRFLGPHLGRPCAYSPSCSSYSLLAIRKHGALVGTAMTFDRLQHEADETRFSPLILNNGEIKVYDPPENNDYWWHRGDSLTME